MTSTLPSNPKRSVSSTLASLFRKASEDHQTEKVMDMSKEYSDSGSVVVKKQRKNSLQSDRGPFWNGAAELNDDERPNIFLYETDEDLISRPPILSIEPKQRLRLLRLQQMRRARQFPMMHGYLETALSSEGHIPGAKRDNNGSNISKLMTSTLPKIKSEFSEGLKRKRWMGDFEYDLSEYDVTKKQRKDLGNLQVPSIDSPKISQPTLRKTSLSKKSNPYINQSELLPIHLTSVQNKLLSGESLLEEATLGTENKTIALKPIIKEQISIQQKVPVKFPSVGFDFISRDTSILDSQSTDTPSKFVPSSLPFNRGQTESSSEKIKNGAKEDNEQMSLFQRSTVEPNRSISPVSEANPLAKDSTLGFNHGQSQEQGNTEENKHLEVNTPEKESLLSVGKPSFSFGAVSNKPSDIKVNPTPTIKNETKKSPTFSLGGNQKNAPVLPSFSIGGNASKAAEIPSFSFGKETVGERKESKSNSFIFDHKSENKDISSTSEKVSELQDGKKAPSFSFAKFAKPEALNSPSESLPEKTPPGSLNATFVFGTGEQKPATGLSSSQDKTPKFKFGSAANKNQETQQSFSFDTGNKNDNKNLLFGETGKKNTSGTFKLSDASETKATQPSFSFGKTTTSLKKSPNGFDNANKGLSLPDNKLSSNFSFGSNIPTSKPSNEEQSTGGFKFDTNGFKKDHSKTNNFFTPSPPIGSSMPTKPSTSLSFGPNGQSSNEGISVPQPSAGGFSFDQNNQKVNFGFKGSELSTTNNSPAFDSSANQPTAAFNFGGSTASSTPQPPALGNGPSTSFQNPAFNPSNSINFNFGSSSSQTPSMIFGNQGPQASSGMFGSGQDIGQQNPANIFNGQQLGQQNEGQFPPQRKIAMPGRRRRRG